MELPLRKPKALQMYKFTLYIYLLIKFDVHIHNKQLVLVHLKALYF